MNSLGFFGSGRVRVGPAMAWAGFGPGLRICGPGRPIARLVIILEFSEREILYLSNSGYVPRQMKVQKVFGLHSNFANRSAAFSLQTL